MSKILDSRKREQAYLLYSRYRNISEVAKEMGIESSTISRWRKEENWDTRLLDIGRRLRGMIEVVEKAKNDLALADMVSELSLIETLEVFVAQSILVDGIRPSKWSDVLSTMKFVAERKDIIFGKSKQIQKELSENQDTSKPENNDEIDVLKTLLENSNKSIDLNVSDYVPENINDDDKN